MSQSVIIPPVHETSPPPFDDDVDDNDIIPTIQNNQLLSSNLSDLLDNSNDECTSLDDNNDTDIAQIQDDTVIVKDENVLTNINVANEEEEKNDNNDANDDDDDNWADFATFETKLDEVSETSFPTASIIVKENIFENDPANSKSNPILPSEQQIESSNNEQTDTVIEDDDDDFGEFSEVQVTTTPQTTSLPTNTLSSEQIESLISTCFPMESVTSSTEDTSFISSELPTFTTYKDQTKQILCLESSLSLWNVLSNISNDPIGIKFQWRKSNTERLFHQALGVNERFRTKSVPLTPEVLQPEKLKSTISVNNESENIDNENKLSTESIRPHFDWKQSGLENPLADNDSTSLSSNISKNEDNVFDANKTLDLDFSVPSIKGSNEEEQIISSSNIQRNDSPVIQQQRHSIPIKTSDLYPGSTTTTTTTTTLNDDAKRIIDTLPNFNFMSAKALMFPIRFNTSNNDESATLY